MLDSSKSSYTVIRRVTISDKKKTNMFRTNKKAVIYLSLNYDGSLLATASKRGTAIRIYNTFSAELLQELRRGAKKADISQLTFHRSSKFLACTSSTEAVHIFEIYEALKSIDDSEYEGYHKRTPKDEIGYDNDKVLLDPTLKNKKSK